jgi:hypothetical protein
LDHSQYQLGQHREPELLDVIRVGLSAAHPAPHQPENWLISNDPWELVERPASARHAPVIAAALSTSPLLLGGTSSSIREAECLRNSGRESLALTEPRDLLFRAEISPFEKSKKARVLFWVERFCYDLPLTDPRYVPAVRVLPEGDHPPSALGIHSGRRILLTVSLSEPLNGICYKLAAAVLVLPGSWPKPTAG